MAMKGSSAFCKAPVLLEPHHQIVLCNIKDTHWGMDLTSRALIGRGILPQRHSLGEGSYLKDTHWARDRTSRTLIGRGIVPQGHSLGEGSYLKGTHWARDLTSRTLIGRGILPQGHSLGEGSYLYVEMQSVYSTASADWAKVSFEAELKLFWIQSFPSQVWISVPRLKNPTIYP